MVMENINNFLISEDQWSKKMNDLSVQWVDKELLELIIGSMDISYRQLRRFIKDTQDWTNKINKKLAKKYFSVRYQYIREAADFLGFPPWFLFYQRFDDDQSRNFNEEIKKVFETIPPKLPIFNIVWKDYSNEKIINAPFNKETASEHLLHPTEIIENNLGKNEFSHESYIKGKWKDIQAYLSKRDDLIPFSGAAIIYSEDFSRYVPIGTLRVVTKQHKSYLTSEINRYGDVFKWSSAWFTVDLSEEEFELHKKYIKGVIQDLSYRFGHYAWEFKFKKDNQVRILYSWHSLRIDDSQKIKEEIEKIITGKFEEVTNPLQLSVACRSKDNQSISFEIESLFSEFRKFLSDSIKKDRKVSSYSRRPNTLLLLLNEGFIEQGTKLKLEHNVVLQGRVDEKVLSATVIVNNNVPKLKWDYDNQEYFITPLTEKIFNNFEVIPTKKMKNGNDFWGRPELKVKYPLLKRIDWLN
jgi:hypothetical protein